MKRHSPLMFLLLLCFSIHADETPNLLLNPNFDFHSLTPHRYGTAVSHTANHAAFWKSDGEKDISVLRESHIPKEALPAFSVRNGVRIEPGKKLYQFFTLPEAGLIAGDKISLLFWGNQEQPKSIAASVNLMKIDSEDGTWSPGEFGLSDKRTFPKHSRGELVNAKAYEVLSDKTGTAPVALENMEILGNFTPGNKSASADRNTVGVQLVFENRGTKPVWIFSPSLVKGEKARKAETALRSMPDYYRHIPRTMQKLWKGEPVHILLMGSSIDRGSANPPMYAYQEDPKSKDFKKPICEAYNGAFRAGMVGRPDLDDSLAYPSHYFSYGGRLKRELMRKFDLPANRILLNFMAADGSCIGESHSGLRAYCELTLTPSPWINGHREGKTWKELYPALFDRPEGPRPDLVIYGSGANEKTDTPNEIAVFEGAVRYLQRNYPGTEFLFCMFQNRGGYTPNPGDLQALALRYQIPFIDFGIVQDLLGRHANLYALVPADGHPQAVTHDLWFKQLDQAFEAADPIRTGQAQLHLPERIHKNTYGWEGEMVTFPQEHLRVFNGNAFILEDTAFNCWVDYKNKDKDGKTLACDIYIDGKKKGSPRAPMKKRDLRNSSFRHGDLSFGDRHILEVSAQNVRLTAVDSKVCPGRRWIGVQNPLWEKGNLTAKKHVSETGAPYGESLLEIPAGSSVSLDYPGTDFSIAWLDSPDGGTLEASVDGRAAFAEKTNQPFRFLNGKTQFLENRKGVTNLPYGMHRIVLTARNTPVKLMGIFAYDSRPNRSNELVERGFAVPGETVFFSAPFKARPVVVTSGGLEVKADQIKPDSVTFSGKSSGSYEAAGASF